VIFFRVQAGCLSDPIRFTIKQVDDAVAPGTNRQSTIANDPANHKSPITNRKSGTPHSMESRVLDALAVAPPPSCSRQETMEHLAILKRWYYRSSKLGEIFFAEESGDLPMRRIVRGISRVFRGEKPAADLNETARDYWINRGKEAELGKD
jgi:hypothetical protein